MTQDCNQCGDEFPIEKLENGLCKSCKEFIEFMEENALQEEHECQ